MHGRGHVGPPPRILFISNGPLLTFQSNSLFWRDILFLLYLATVIPLYLDRQVVKKKLAMHQLIYNIICLLYHLIYHCQFLIIPLNPKIHFRGVNYILADIATQEWKSILRYMSSTKSNHCNYVQVHCEYKLKLPII